MASRSYLEVACFNTESALRAVAARADRIELCADRASGGITPSLELLRDLSTRIPRFIPIHAMVRPRGGDFVYSEAELDEMASSIKAMKPYCNGFVFGVLKEDRSVDTRACSELVELARPLRCTFHRAFDEAQWENGNPMEDLSNCGLKTVLAAGGPGKAAENHLQDLLWDADRWDVTSIAGGGVRAAHLLTLRQYRPMIKWFHSSAIVDDGELADEKELQELVAVIHSNLWEIFES